jgi:hypothetical protein
MRKSSNRVGEGAFVIFLLLLLLFLHEDILETSWIISGVMLTRQAPWLQNKKPCVLKKKKMK